MKIPLDIPEAHQQKSAVRAQKNCYGTGGQTKYQKNDFKKGYDVVYGLNTYKQNERPEWREGRVENIIRI